MLHSALFQELSCIHSALLTLDADEHTGIAPVLPHVLTRVSLLPLSVENSFSTLCVQ